MSFLQANIVVMPRFARTDHAVHKIIARVDMSVTIIGAVQDLTELELLATGMQSTEVIAPWIAPLLVTHVAKVFPKLGMKRSLRHMNAVANHSSKETSKAV